MQFTAIYICTHLIYTLREEVNTDTMYMNDYVHVYTSKSSVNFQNIPHRAHAAHIKCSNN